MTHIKNFVKGIIIGLSTLVPGVSGGTMAIILGLYDKIIHSISSFFKDIKNNIIFLGVVGVGGAIGLFGFSNVMAFLMENIRYVMIFLFLGIIAGGMPVLIKKSEINFKKITPLWAVLFFVGIAAVVAMSFSKSTVVNLATGEGAIMMLFMVLAGFIYAITLILPGISGSFFLLTIGLYEITMTAISDRNLSYLIPFAIGIILGVVLTTKLLENLMKKHLTATYIVIIGFVIGSVVVLFLENIPSGINILYAVISFIAGYFLTYCITRLGEKTNTVNQV